MKAKALIPGAKLRHISVMADPSQKATAFIFFEQGWTDTPSPPMVAFPFAINFPEGLFSPFAHLFRVSRQQRQGQKCRRDTGCFVNTQRSSKHSKACCSSAQRSWGRSVPTVGFLQTQKDAFLLWKAKELSDCLANKQNTPRTMLVLCWFLGELCKWIKSNLTCFLHSS